MIKERIASRVKGALSEREDFWYLCYDPKNDVWSVEHEWDHINAYKLDQGGNRGSSVHTLDDWISGKKPGWENIDTARAKILATL